jgi:hypothetical protein
MNRFVRHGIRESQEHEGTQRKDAKAQGRLIEALALVGSPSSDFVRLLG